jgi:anti-sigma factor RsiW
VYSADRRRPTELGAEQRDDLARWVSNRLNHRVAPPDLEPAGYRYMGGRLAATPDGPGGLFMYDNAQGVRLTVFVLPMTGAANAPIQEMNIAPMDGFAWIDKSVGYAVVGKLPVEELHKLADQVRQQFARTT